MGGGRCRPAASPLPSLEPLTWANLRAGPSSLMQVAEACPGGGIPAAWLPQWGGDCNGGGCSSINKAVKEEMRRPGPSAALAQPQWSEQRPP